ncbi:ABC transporter permease [Rhizobium leguminosarum]|uniref:ABC transporter permease n=1 Tax=Rhizobium leguminosarum TaxID=384 RepID=UPI001C941B61|nr:ABC transporter permease [Rhizobium leguminosarum]MBY5549975.1 ABC transporter permease [Rhizobium leguminosarum]MBY5565174.1 ABC transporter permease [Rhizobium leguminosarum]MBY5734712.1 ABC transporter permease [Rhizobium leguminosarum]
METLSTFVITLGSRLITALIQLWVIATLVFSIMYIMPGDPVLLLLGPESNPSPETVAAMRQQLGLDQPVLSQYLKWLGYAATGDLGNSLDGVPVVEYVTSSLPKTIELASTAIVLAAIIGVPVGIAAALRRGRFLDGLLTSLSTLGISVPVYILGSLLVLLLSLKLGWLPSSGYTDISRNAFLHFQKLTLPAVTLGLGLAASIARMTRSSMLEILGRDFVRSLRARGMRERRVIWLHVLRNAAIPIVTIIGLQLGNLMGGTVLVEALFNWPGLSTLLVTAVSNRNYPLVQGSILTIAALFILINLCVDILYSLLDPRIRRKRA